MSGTVLANYDQQLDRPCTQAAWGWDEATSAKFMMSFVHLCTLSFTNSSVRVLESRGRRVFYHVDVIEHAEAIVQLVWLLLILFRV